MIPNDELIAEWSHEFHDTPARFESDYGRFMARKAAAWAVQQTAEDCAKVCDDRERMHRENGHAGLCISEANRCAEAIRTKYLQPIEKKV